MDAIASTTTVRKSGSSATVLRSLNLTPRIPGRTSPPTLPPFTNFIAAFQVIQVRLRLTSTASHTLGGCGGHLLLKLFFNSYFNKSTICINLANRLQVAPRLKQVMVLRELEMELEYSEEDEDSMFAHDQTLVVSGRQENVDSRGSDIVDAVEMETEDNLRPSKRVKTTDVKIWTLTQLATTVP